MPSTWVLLEYHSRAHLAAARARGAWYMCRRAYPSYRTLPVGCAAGGTHRSRTQDRCHGCCAASPGSRSPSISPQRSIAALAPLRHNARARRHHLFTFRTAQACRFLRTARTATTARASPPSSVLTTCCLRSRKDASGWVTDVYHMAPS